MAKPEAMYFCRNTSRRFWVQLDGMLVICVGVIIQIYSGV